MRQISPSCVLLGMFLSLNLRGPEASNGKVMNVPGTDVRAALLTRKDGELVLRRSRTVAVNRK